MNKQWQAGLTSLEAIVQELNRLHGVRLNDDALAGVITLTGLFRDALTDFPVAVTKTDRDLVVNELRRIANHLLFPILGKAITDVAERIEKP